MPSSRSGSGPTCSEERTNVRFQNWQRISAGPAASAKKRLASMRRDVTPCHSCSPTLQPLHCVRSSSTDILRQFDILAKAVLPRRLHIERPMAGPTTIQYNTRACRWHYHGATPHARTLLPLPSSGVQPLLRPTRAELSVVRGIVVIPNSEP